MKTNTWIFRISTGLIVAVLSMGAFMELSKAPNAVESFMAIGYPVYLLAFLGVAKLLGAIALIIQSKLPKMVVEWAYAGIAFDFLGASYSHFASGDAMAKIILPLALFAVLAISRIYSSKTRA